MILGIPCERFVDERRVGLGPAGVRALVEAGATVHVETGAGDGAGWSDADYETSGGTIVFSREEVLGRPDMILKVLPPDVEESDLMRDDQILMSYLQLPLARREVFDNFVDRGITAIGLENVEKDGGRHPVRHVMSEIAGALAVHAAVEYLGSDKGGRGVLFGGLPGVPPASVGIIGAGVVGSTAAQHALNMGAHVILIDHRVAPLRDAIHLCGKGLQTGIINEHNLEKMVKFVDVLIGAVLLEDYPTPHIISREMVKMMKPRAVIVDVAIDQGGSVETSRPTSLSDPVYIEEGVIHYAVPNMPSRVSRTSTRAFQNQVVPLAKKIVTEGVDKALRDHPYMASGLNMYKGTVTRDSVAKTFGVEWKRGSEVIQ